MDTDTYIKDLKELTAIVSCSFAEALKCYERNLAGELPSEITSRLQFFDIINQRIQHLVDTDQKVMKLYIDNLFKQSFLHLQSLQFSIIVFDLLESISLLDSFVSNKTKVNNSATPADRQSIEQMCSKIESELVTLAGQSKLTGVPGLTNMQKDICRGLYTMESERLVLEWYIANPRGGYSELLDTYKFWLSDNDNASIELFEND